MILCKQAFASFTIREECPVKVRLSGRDSTLFVDIVIWELRVAIECHWRQHYEFSHHLHGTRDVFAKSIERDMAKKEQLKAPGFSFVVVKFCEEKNQKLVNSSASAMPPVLTAILEPKQCPLQSAPVMTERMIDYSDPKRRDPGVALAPCGAGLT